MKSQTYPLGFFPPQTTLRIDDISINVDNSKLAKLLDVIRKQYPDLLVVLAISPIVFDLKEHKSEHPERIFPKILNALSDYREFYKAQLVGIPQWLKEIAETYDCKIATHGLVHVDHRLLGRSAQELSIILSASLCNTNVFVPPFNKFNSKTLDICSENSIDIAIWENGWKHLGYNKFKDDLSKYYMHIHDFTEEHLYNIFTS